jgi:peptidoglycan hydrolase CwlO-like protein
MHDKWNKLMYMGAAGATILTGVVYSIYSNNVKLNEMDREIALAENVLQQQKDERKALSGQLASLVDELVQLEERMRSQEKSIKELDPDTKKEQRPVIDAIKSIGFHSESVEKQCQGLEEKALQLMEQQESNESLLSNLNKK